MKKKQGFFYLVDWKRYLKNPFWFGNKTNSNSWKLLGISHFSAQFEASAFQPHWKPLIPILKLVCLKRNLSRFCHLRKYHVKSWCASLFFCCLLEKCEWMDADSAGSLRAKVLLSRHRILMLIQGGGSDHLLIQGSCGLCTRGIWTAALIQLLSVRPPLPLLLRSPCLLRLVCSLSDIDHVRQQTPEQAQPGGVGVGHAGTSQHLRKQHKGGAGSFERSRVLRSLKDGGEKKISQYCEMILFVCLSRVVNWSHFHWFTGFTVIKGLLHHH